MKYNSTRNRAVAVTAAQAIATGISEEGGLFVPAELPKLTAADIQAMVPMTYVERATAVLSRFLSDFTEEEVAQLYHLLGRLYDKATTYARRETEEDPADQAFAPKREGGEPAQ